LGAFVWECLQTSSFISLLIFVFVGYPFFGIYLYKKRKKTRSWKIELLFVFVSLICTECWFWMVYGERFYENGTRIYSVIFDQANYALMISAVAFYFGVFFTRFKNIFFLYPMVLAFLGFLGLLLVNASFFIGTP
jgi:hypothetical protein